MYRFINYLTESEAKPPKDLTQTALPYARNALGKSLSKAALDYHYGSLYKGYVDRYNAGEGDPEFNEAGAFLHDIYFTQYREPKGSNNPLGKSLDLINEKFESFDKFKKEFETEAMKIQGSGWIYLNHRGEIKTIKNHKIHKDIVILIDWWEHSFAIDFRADKKAYLRGQWKIMNWETINQRI